MFSRRTLRFGLAGGFLLLAAAASLPPLKARAEAWVRGRIEAEAATRGARASVERVSVGLVPPLRVEGLVLERSGVFRFRAERAVFRLTPRLRPLSRWLSGVELGRVWVTLPGGHHLELPPSVWRVREAPGSAFWAEREGPGGRVALSWSPQPSGARAEAHAEGLLLASLLRLPETPLRDLGLLDGEASLEAKGAAVFDLMLKGRWRLSTGGAEVSGSAQLASEGEGPRVELAVAVDKADLGRVLAASGVDKPAGLDELGTLSLSVHVAGRLSDPSSLSVTQKLDFAPPRKPPEALERLKGAFVHEAERPDGSRRAIDVSPDSPDFVPLEEVPPLFVRTLLLGEDAGFFGHRGLDLSELPAALATDWARGGAARGASTLSQQLAKNLFLSREKSLGRKLQELVLALLLESTLDKRRILEIYLNVIEWGPDLYGLRPAARRYFGKAPRALTPKEMAFLVAIIPGPVKYQRSFAEGELTPGFQPLVENLLAKLRSTDLITEEEYQAALAEPLAFRREQGPPPPGVEPAT